MSSNSCIAHDSCIGQFTFIGPAVYICGRVEVGESCYIGVGAKILPNVKIGKNSVIAAGSIVNKNVKANSRVIGMSAKYFDVWFFFSRNDMKVDLDDLLQKMIHRGPDSTKKISFKMYYVDLIDYHHKSEFRFRSANV